MTTDWQPTASLACLQARAQMLAAARRFMQERTILEVETPALTHCAVSDPNLRSLAVAAGDHLPLFLHTSPEYCMKRLLAAGSGDIYQICKVFRGEESSALHNPEFTMLEWYRLGFPMQSLIDEVALLLRSLLAISAGAQFTLPPQQITYHEALRRHAGIDLMSVSEPQLRQRALRSGLAGDSAARCDRDQLLDFIMAVEVGPLLGREQLTFVTHYPASQAALARLDPQYPDCALRFELFGKAWSSPMVLKNSPTRMNRRHVSPPIACCDQRAVWTSP